MKNGKLTVAIVGMGFGSCFLPIRMWSMSLWWIPIRTS